MGISIEYPYTTLLGKILGLVKLLKRKQMLIFGLWSWGQRKKQKTFTENQDEYYICTPIHTSATNMLILGKMFANV